MRVLFLTDSLSDLDGVGRYSVRLIRAMEALEPTLEVRVLLSRKHRPTSEEVPDRWRVEVGLPPDYFFHMAPSRFWPNLAHGVWRAWRLAAGCDLVHAIKDYPHNLVALRAARLRKIPCVATGHGTYTVQPLLDRRHAERARATYEGFAAMISVSGFTAARLATVVGEPALSTPVHVVPNAVDAEAYAAAPEFGERLWHKVPFTLSIGELKERKGQHLTLAAFARVAERFPKLHHFVVGKGTYDEYHRSLVESVEAAGLERRVHFLGNVDEAEKIDLLRRAEVFVHAPVTAADGGFEGFGLVYLEASASGTPCLGTLGCGAEDAIIDGETGFLVQPSVDGLARKLGALLGDDELRARMGAAGVAHARASSWAENAERVLAIYRGVLA